MVHLQHHGFEIEEVISSDHQTMARARRLHGVPDHMASCHTALVGPYVVEGHVPAAVLLRLLDERPAGVVGLAVPGMPPGPPGLEDPRPKPYTVFAIRADGSLTAYDERWPPS